jgi:glycosyltransferase involved in cell wall biosynthesis
MRKPIVLSVGGHLRDFETMRAVAKELKARWSEDLDFVLVNGRRKTADLNEDSGIHTLVDVSEEQLREWYRSADVTVVPLLDGTCNNAILESLACGTPVVATAVGTVGEMAAQDQGILAVPPGDAEAMAASVSTVLTDSHPEVRSCAARAEAERLDWSRVAGDLVQVYEALL